MLFSSTPAQSHDSAAILLRFCTLGIEKMADVIDADNSGHIDRTGLRIHFNFDKMGLPAHYV